MGATVRPDPSLVRLLALLLLVGVGISGALTWDHQRYLLDPDVTSGLCRQGGGCEISRTSRFSEVPMPAQMPGVPLSLLGFGAYLAAAALLWLGRQGQRLHARSLLVGLAGLWTFVSVFLAALSLWLQGSLCPWCTGLYGVNVATLLVSWRMLGGGLGPWLDRLPDALTGRAMGTALVTFVVAVGFGYGAYAGPLFALDDRLERERIARAGAILSEPIVPLHVEGRPSKGPVDAPVHLVEFADFQCPHCVRLFEAVEAVRARHSDAVRVTYLSFPLDNSCNRHVPVAFHPSACLLARAGECAHQQRRFFDLAPRLFDHVDGVSEDEVLAVAVAAGLDGAEFSVCLNATLTLRAVQSDIATGREVGLRATPTFFINGRMVEGTRSAPVIEAMVQAVLKSTASP